jgi:hypothetical protein
LDPRNAKPRTERAEPVLMVDLIDNEDPRDVNPMTDILRADPRKEAPETDRELPRRA